MSEFVSFNQAKEWLRDQFKTGKAVKCPCCDQTVKRYKRKLNSGMAITLIRIYKHHNRSQVYVKEFLRKNKMPNNHDWTLLKHWGLLEEVANTNPEKKNSGVWKITDLGIHFIANRTLVPSHLYFYNSEKIGKTNTTTSIIKALGNKFNYQELMRA